MSPRARLDDATRRRFLLSGAALVVGACASGDADDAPRSASSGSGDDTLDGASPEGQLIDRPDARPEVTGDAPPAHRLTTAGRGWARTSANAPIFRKDALTSDATHQYAAWYDDDAQVSVARRALGSEDWTSAASGFAGRPRDAHNAISLMLDGAGYLHLCWDHHVDPLRYARSVAPGTLAFSPPESMLGRDEGAVTYPEFLALPSGDLLFAYRDGRSGDGRLILNRYATASARWSRVQSLLLDGEGERNAYWQLHVDPAGTLHLSWLWRESSDVATNHDIHYARSTTGGETWSDVHGAPLALPITAAGVAPVRAIPENSNLINQTSIVADAAGVPVIATYFRPSPDAVTDIHVVAFDPPSATWRTERVTRRASDFALSGRGTKSLPISRPQIVAEARGDERWLHVLYRDAERGDRAVLASSERTAGSPWTYRTLPGGPLDRWEPAFDSRAWRDRGELHVYLQRVGQVDLEGVDESYPPTDVRVLEIALPGTR